MKTVIIFGGGGYIGRNIVYQMARKGFKIIIPYQSYKDEAKLRLYGNFGQITPIKFNNLEDIFIKRIINQSDLIINLKTIWEEKGNITFRRNIFEFNKKLVNLVKNSHKNSHFIFFSGIGVDKNSSSERIKSIANTEEFIEKNLDNYSIIRPGIVIGENDLFLGRILPIMKLIPVFPLFGSGKNKFQIVYIVDLVRAIEKIIFLSKKNNIFELTDNETYTYKEIYKFIAQILKVKRIFVPIPFFLASFGTKIISYTPINLLTKEQLFLFKKDNIASRNYKSFEDLGIKPMNSKEIIRKIIKEM